MNKIVLKGEIVHVQLTGWSWLWALERAITVPKSSVVRAYRLSGHPWPTIWRVGTAVIAALAHG